MKSKFILIYLILQFNVILIFANKSNNLNVLYFRFALPNKDTLDKDTLNIKVIDNLKKEKETKFKFDDLSGLLNFGKTPFLKWATADFNYKNKSYAIFIVNTQHYNIDMFYYDSIENRMIESINNLIQKKSNTDILFATNGGMFEPDKKPVGLYIENGIVVKPINLKESIGNFYMNFNEQKNSNGFFLIDTNGNGNVYKANEFNIFIKNKIKFATQSGPLLVYNDSINSKFNINSTNLNIRNGVGIIDSNFISFVISNEPVTFYEMASIFKNLLHCKKALYLDGGISRMYIKDIKPELGGNFGVLIGIIKKNKK